MESRPSSSRLDHRAGSSPIGDFLGVSTRPDTIVDVSSKRPRRSHPRFPIGAFVSPEDGNAGYYTMDLCRDGMSLLRLADAQPKRTHFTVEIPLAGSGRRVHALARTVRKRNRGPLTEVGIRFCYMPPEDRRLLDAYLAARR